MRKGAHVTSADFRNFITQNNGNSDAVEEIAFKAHSLYRQYLKTCREKHSFRYLQPGRCLCPGPWGDVPLMWFCPLPVPNGRLRSGSFSSLMEARYEKYKADIREKFFDAYFSEFDRQIILVDVLSALHANEEAFRDTCLALSRIADSFRYSGSLVSKLTSKINIGKRQIDRVMFAATKVDHVPERQRDALYQLLSSMTSEAIQGKNVKVHIGGIASIRCTTDDTAIIGGRSVQVVNGLPLGKDRIVKFWPGDVPVKPPNSEFWSSAFFELPVFQPPKIDGTGATGIPHIGLDNALSFLLGDAL